MRGVALFLFAIGVIVVAGVAAAADGRFAAPAGPSAVIAGDGPVLRPAGEGAVRGATGRAHLAVLAVPADAAVARDMSRALTSAGARATFSLDAVTVWRDPGLARELVGDGFEVALAGLSSSDEAMLPEAVWRAETTLALRSVEGAAGRPVSLYAPRRLEGPALDRPAIDLAVRAMDLGLVVVVPSPPDARGLDGLVVVRDAPSAQEVVAQTHATGAAIVTAGELAGVTDAAPVDALSIATATALSVAARSLTAAGDLIAVLSTIAVLLLLVRLVVIMLAIALPRRVRTIAGPEPAVAVLVPAHDEATGIGAAIRALRASDVGSLQVVVIDDGSSDGTADVARAAAGPDGRVTVIEQPNGGKASALRRAFERTTTPIVVVVDADSVVEPDAVRRLLAPFADPRIGAVAGNVKVGNRGGLLGPLQHLEYVMGINLDRRLYDRVNAITVVPGALGAFRRAAIMEAGGFADETLAEDADLTLAIAGLGYRIVHAPGARVWTEAPREWSGLYRQRFRWAYGMLQVLWKHRGLVFSRRATNAGRIGLPFVVLFGFGLPLLAPAVDLAFLYGVVAGGRADLLLLFGLFNALQLLAAALALRLDGEPMWQAAVVPAYQLGYRQLMSFVVLRAILAAIAGAPVGWGRIRRHGLATKTV